VNIDHEKEWKTWESQVATIENAAKKVKGVTTQVTVPEIANHTPKLSISWDQSQVKLTRKQMQENLRNGSPSIETMGEGDNTINITVFMLKPGEEKIVASRVSEELKKASA
jgi:L-seryl-tRNA(Ser) seleniumtransferase